MSRGAKARLLPHEKSLLASGELEDITHGGSSSVWLSSPSSELEDLSMTLVYRPMGDTELLHLLNYSILPDTQPYQTIVRGAEGRNYAEKYLRGHKKVDSSPTTVVEFAMPSEAISTLWAMQSKNEEGAISHGLGDKGGKGLPLFNACLQDPESASFFRIVLVKRSEIKQKEAKQQKQQKQQRKQK
eukprot:TRINITY_DN656_c1_g1_i1.p1 TRINITY_DN656_c1_g1~~TRINITY_DN656_c1_g1_i1.p1  ORF type:complete len:186 (-),score=37.83 TRINITY_DN656_c1_g1_i1:151-708(-)